MNIVNRVEDALFLWEHGRIEGAFMSALVAVAATARRIYPDREKIGDREAFESFLKQGVYERISIEYRGQCHPVYHIFYKWFRCELVHEGGLPIDIELMSEDESSSGMLSIRAGGAPDYILRISESWFFELVNTVVSSPVNSDVFTLPAYSHAIRTPNGVQPEHQMESILNALQRQP